MIIIKLIAPSKNKSLSITVDATPSIALLLILINIIKRGMITGILNTAIKVELLPAFEAMAETNVKVPEKAIAPEIKVTKKYDRF